MITTSPSKQDYRCTDVQIETVLSCGTFVEATVSIWDKTYHGPNIERLRPCAFEVDSVVDSSPALNEAQTEELKEVALRQYREYGEEKGWF